MPKEDAKEQRKILEAKDRAKQKIGYPQCPSTP
jgi:hypothetical protein